MPLNHSPRTGLLSPLRVALTVALACTALLLAVLVRPQAAHAACGGSAVLTGSCFEGGDGNLNADGGLLFGENADWATVADEMLFSDPVSPGTTFGNSSDEQNPTSWSLTSGEPSTSKLDITAAATRIERIGNDIWMHVGFTMKAAAGSANVLVELNRNSVPAGTNPLPVRSADDALIQFTGNQNQAARIGLCQWVGNRFGQGPGGNANYGWHTTPLPGSLISSSNKDCTQISGGGNPTAIGKVNDGVILNNLSDEVQQVTLTGPNAGTFTLTFQGQTTAPIARNATAATVQSALVALSNIDVTDVAVTAPAAGGPFNVRFTGAYAATDVPQMTGAGSALSVISTLGQGGATTYLPSPPFQSPTIPADVFGEMSINLTQSLGAGGANPCFNFGSVWLHTYNGNSISSIMADYVGPQSLIGASSCSVAVDKKVAVSQDGTTAPADPAAYHEGTPADPSSAQVGDYLWYRLAVTNTGTAPLTPNVTDAGCDLGASPTPIEKRNASNVADTTPSIFDAGDVWTYLCKHQLAAADPEPYVNTVKATGTSGSFTTPEVEDSASTTSNGTLTVVKDFTGPFEAGHRVDLLIGGAVKAANVGDGGATPAVTVPGGSTVSFGEAFQTGSAAQYVSSAACVDTKGTAGSGDDTPVSSTFDAQTLAGSTTVAGRKAILCTITNARRTGTIKVVKDIVPVDAQIGDPGLFDLQVDGATKRADAGDGDATATIVLPTGSHSVGELAGASTSLSDYDASVSCKDDLGATVTTSGTASPWSLSLASGRDVVCTITNTRKKGSVKLVKDIVPVDEQLGDPGKFDLTIDGQGSYGATKSDAGDGDSVTATVPTGDVDLSEVAGTNTSLSDYTSTYSCSAPGHTDVTGSGIAISDLAVASGDSWVCTITNTRKKGTVKLVKDIVPVDEQLGDPGKFDLTIDGQGSYGATKSDAGDGDSVTATVPTGDVDLSEAAGTNTSLSDYTSTYSCSAPGHTDVTGSGTSIADLAVASGDSWVCTITNTRKKGTVKLVKDIVPVDEQLGDPGKFDLTIDGQGSYGATKSDAGDGDSVTATVPTGDVDLSEAAGTNTSLSDYTSTYSCSAPGHTDITGSGTSIADLAVASGDSWVCTITNTRKKGTVKLVKDIVPVDEQLGDPGKFDLTIDGQGSYGATKSDAGDGDSVTATVPTGDVDLSEAAGTNTNLNDYTSSYSCSADGHTDITGSGIAISDLAVASGDSWVCTITNTRKKGTVKLVKDIVPVDEQLGDPGKFDLTIDGQGSYGATKSDAGDGDSVTATVPTGDVDLSEAAGTNTSLSDYTSTYSCSADGHTDITGSGTSIADLPVADGDSWVCTLTNTRKKSTVKLTKVVIAVDEQLGDPGKFNLHIDGQGAYDATKSDAVSGDSVSRVVPTGGVDFSEAAGTSTDLGDYTSSYSCVNTAEGSEDAPVTGTGTTITNLVVHVGDLWHCTFTNTRKHGTVTLVKDIVPVDGELSDPGRFDLHIDGQGDYDAVKDEAGDGDSVSRVVPTGAVDLFETADGETTLSDYASAYTCENLAEGSDDAPVTGGGTRIEDLMVASGDEWRCVLQNTRGHGSVKLVKDIVPVSEQLGDPGLFDLHIDGEGSYDATKADAGDGDSVELAVPNGNVDLSESAGTATSLSDYTSAYRCENAAEGSEDAAVEGSGTAIADLAVTAGDRWVCTLTNTRKKGRVTVVKHLDPVTDGGLFDLSINGPLGYDVTGSDLGHNGSVSIDVPTGSVSAAEKAGTGTELGDYISSYVCENHEQGSEDPQVKGSGTSLQGLQVASGDEWVCTFTNVRKPVVIVEKVTDPQGDTQTSFAFTSGLPVTAAGDGSQAIGGGGAFSLKDGQQVRTLVTPGTYSVTEADGYALGYRLKGATCVESVPNGGGEFELTAGGQSESDRTRSFTADAGETITCTFVNEKLVGLQVVAKTPKSQSVYLDQNVSYTYEVTNTGTSDLTDVTVVDDKCPGPAVRKADKTGDNDGVLEPGEVWSYTCTVAASAIFTGDLTQVTNTVTVNAKDQTGKPVPPSKDTAVTNLLKPGIAIDKTGPATATAGDLITYSLLVTNTGNTTFNDGLVVLADQLCQAPPALLSKNGDSSPETLSPGESWTYSCQVQTQVGQTKVDNTGTVNGTDQGGRKVTASDTASTTLSQPAAQALPNPPVTRVPGSAKLRGTVGCAIAKYASASISGKQIKSVTFQVNGKKIRTLTKPTSGSTYTLRLAVKSLAYGTHKVTAKVTFATASRTKTKTLTLQFSRCKPRVVQPKFTG